MLLNDKPRVGFILAATLALACGQAQAEGAGMEMKWRGFLTAGAAVTNVAPRYDEKFNEDGATDDTRFGLTASAQLDRDWWAGAQLASHGSGVDDPDRKVNLDWAYARYQPSETLAVNLGRLKFPSNLVSEYYDVGFTYPWIRPPEEFYSHTPLGPNLTAESINGASVIFSRKSGSGVLALQPFIGESNIDDGFERKTMGVKAGMSLEHMEMLLGYTRSKLRLDSASDRFGEADGKGLRSWNLGFSYDRGAVVYAEYGRSEIEDNPAFDSTAGYATFGYRFGKYLPHATYAMFDQDSGLGQKSMALGLRRELTAFSSLKFEWKRIDPDQRRVALAGGAQPVGLFESLPEKSRVNFYSVAIDFVF